MDRGDRRKGVGLHRAAAAMLVAALSDNEPKRRSGLSPGRAVAVGALLGTVGRMAVQRRARFVGRKVPDAPVDGDTEGPAGRRVPDPPMDQDPEGPTGQAELHSGSNDAMTRSEETLEVRAERRRRGRVRLRKYIVTEEVQCTVSLRREEIRVEEEPSPEEGAGPATGHAGASSDGAIALSSGDVIVLYKEVPAIEKRVVPAERVRVVKDTHTEQADVVEELRRERIDLESDTGR